MKRNLFCIALAMLIGMIAAPALLSAQQQDDIVIVNQDGEEIKGQIVLGTKQKDGQARGVTAKIEGDKIIIIDANGEKQEIDIAGAKSVSVQQSVKTVDKDGDQQTVRSGKAVIIGPDGEKKVVELDGPIQMGEGGNIFMFQTDEPGEMGFDMFQKLPMLKFRQGLPVIPGQFQATGTIGKYMIGVVCKPVPEELRSHLDLESGIGLLVESVTEDGPAAEAGIQKHDILMYAQDEQLASNEDLVKIIQTAGEDDSSVSIGAVRAGKEISFKVEPAERPADQLLRGPANFQFQRFGPGVIIGEGELEMPNIEGLPAIPAVPDMQELQNQMKQQMEEMQKQMREMREQMKRMREDGSQ